MKRIISLILILALCLSFAVFADDSTGITVTGEGIATEISISLTELAAMEQTQIAYSTSNNYPTEKVVYAEGVALTTILEKAGICDTATMIKFTSTDGYYKTFTINELISENRYTYINGEKTQVAAIIALKTSEDSFADLESGDPLLMMGQRGEGEQTNPWFVKSLASIELQTAAVEKWDTAMIDPASMTVTAGRELTVSYKNMDSVKIYYTTDGTDPSYDSEMYNPSTTYFQPDLTLPFIINETTTIKLMVAGVGKENSDIATYTYTVESDGFADMIGYDWASEAVDLLAEYGIINGVGDNNYDPSGTLTRAALSKVMVLLAGESESVYTGGFTDVAEGAWYAGYVEKAVELGIFTGMGDGTFAPESAVTKEQMLTVLLRALGYSEQMEDYAETVTVAGDISPWARSAVELAYALDMIEIGNIATEIGEGIEFAGTSSASRADIAVTVLLSGILS